MRLDIKVWNDKNNWLSNIVLKTKPALNEVIKKRSCKWAQVKNERDGHLAAPVE